MIGANKGAEGADVSEGAFGSTGAEGAEGIVFIKISLLLFSVKSN